MKVSVIIPIYNRKEYTKKCLESIFAFGSKYAYELIVVDNASSDGSGEYLNGLKDKIISIHNVENKGFAKACNQGAKVANGEYLLFLNNDTIVTEHWVDVLIEELDIDPDVAIAGNKLLFPDETIQHAGVVFSKDKIPYHIHYREIKEKPYVNKKRAFQAVTAACMIIRKNIFDKVGGFNEEYLNGYEDVDLCLKVRSCDKGIMYCPDSVVYHYESISEGRDDKYKENLELFLKKWANKIIPDDYVYLKEDGTLNQTEIIKLQEDLIQHLIQENNQKDQEIGFMKSSKFWKLREKYHIIKNKLKTR
ncbi:MAG: glycosyltransferase family 2 protein [Pseudomonadota bacterium]